MEHFYQVLTWVGIFLYWLVIAGVTMRVVFKRRVVGVSLAWLMIIYIIPIGGVIAYLLVGELNLGKKRAERAQEMFQPFADWFRKLYDCPGHQPQQVNHYARPVTDLCENRLGIPALSGNTLSLLDSPRDILRALINDIHQAKETIHLEFYIWHPGGLADEVATSLIIAAKRGVKVKILLDAAGSMRFFRSHWPKLMRLAGVEITEALAVSPLRMFLRRLDLRQHRKIVVVDNIAYTGSMNLVDPEYFKTDAGVGQWIDVMVRVTGPTVSVLNCIQTWDWEVETGQRYLPQLPSCELISPDNPNMIQVIPSGPGMPDEIIHQVLLLSIYQAKKSVVITTPYFVPSENLLHALESTAERGLSVHIVIPDKNDSVMVEWASRSFFTELLTAGVKIHRFHAGLLHTKSVIIDDTHCLIGTVNLDMRSLWLNFEVTLAVDDPAFTRQLSKLQQEYIRDSVHIELNEWEKRPVINKLVEQFFYMFSPLL